MTTNLNITEVPVSSAQKTVLINSAFEEIDSILSATAAVDVSAGGLVMVPPSQFTRSAAIMLTGAPADAFGLGLPATPKAFIIVNNSSQEATVQVPGAGTMVVVPSTSSFMLFSNGTDIISLSSSAPTGPASMSIEIEDEGASVVSPVQTINFTGEGVTATMDVPGQANIDIPLQEGMNLTVQGDGTTIAAPASTINFTGSGVETSMTSPGVVDVAINTAPASSGPTGRFYNGMTGELGLGNSTSRATKGNIFTPLENMTLFGGITAVDPGGTAEQFQMRIFEMSDASGSATIVSDLGSSPLFDATGTTVQLDRFFFSSGINLVAGRHYFVGVSIITNGSGDPATPGTAVRIVSSTGRGVLPNAPVDVLRELIQFDRPDPSVGDAVDQSQTGSSADIGLDCLVS